MRELKIHHDFRTLSTRLETRFDLKEAPANARRELLVVKQQEGESLADFGQRVIFLSIKGHPGAREKTIESIAVEHLLKGCRHKDAAKSAMDRNPRRVVQAVKYIKRALVNQKVLSQTHQRSYSGRRVSFEEESSPSVRVSRIQTRSPPVRAESPRSLSPTPPRVRNTGITPQNLRNKDVRPAFKQNAQKSNLSSNPSSSVEARLLNLERSLTRLNARLDTTPPRDAGNQQSPVQSPKVIGPCYSCGQSGHFRANCPNKTLSPSSSPNNRTLATDRFQPKGLGLSPTARSQSR